MQLRRILDMRKMLNLCCWSSIKHLLREDYRVKLWIFELLSLLDFSVHKSSSTFFRMIDAAEEDTTWEKDNQHKTVLSFCVVPRAGDWGQVWTANKSWQPRFHILFGSWLFCALLIQKRLEQGFCPAEKTLSKFKSLSQSRWLQTTSLCRWSLPALGVQSQSSEISHPARPCFSCLTSKMKFLVHFIIPENLKFRR